MARARAETTQTLSDAVKASVDGPRARGDHPIERRHKLCRLGWPARARRPLMGNLAHHG